MKTKILLLTIIFCLSLVYAAGDNGYERDEVDHIAPDYLASFYDHYTINFLNARTLGMGSTTVSLQGGIENALSNPAAFKAGTFTLYFEGLAKGSVQEMVRYAEYVEEETRDTIDRQTFEAGMPSGMLGFGFPAAEYLSLGASISIPQTIRYNMLSRLLPTGAFIDRFPSMVNYQTTLTLTGHIENFSIGLNAIHNYYTFRELRIIAPHFHKEMFEESVFRFQPGLYYGNGQFTFGTSYKFAAEQEMRVLLNRFGEYQVYNAHFPAVLETGLSYRYDDYLTIAFALEYEQTSNQYEGFDDRLRLKLGAERKFDSYDLRAGLISVPGVYTGPFAIPEDETTEDAYDIESLPYEYGIVEDTDQLLITGGLTYYFRDVDLNFALAKDVLQNFDLFQFVVSVNIRLGDIIARGPQAESR